MNTRQYFAAAAIVAGACTAEAQDPQGYFEVEGRVMAPSCLNDTPFVWGVTLSGDGKQIFFGAETPDIWTATLDESSGLFTGCHSVNDVSSTFWDVPGSLSADGREFWFESTRAGGLISLFVAARSPEGGFLPARHVAEFDVLGQVFRPQISRAGYELIFCEGFRGLQTFDLWIAWRYDLDEPFTADQARPLDEINSQYNEFGPALAGDGRTLLWTGYRTNSHAGGPEFGSSSVWMATRPEPFDPQAHDEPPPFRNARRLTADPPDTHFYDIAISDDWPADGARVYFVSCSPEQCSQQGPVYDIYSATWNASPSDCNQNSVPDDEDLATGASPDENGNGVPDECDPCDTHCVGMTSEPINLREANVRVTLDGVDEAGETVLYTLRGRTGFGAWAFELGPQASPVFDLDLSPGDWILQGSVDDGSTCGVPAADSRCWGSFTVPDAPLLFIRGDCTGDGDVNVSDAVCILNWLFSGDGATGCVAAANTTGDAAANLSDATYLLNHLFAGGPPPAPPFPDCGPGTLAADEALGCEDSPGCR